MAGAKTELVVLSRSDVGNVWRNIKRLPEGYVIPGLCVVRWESGLFFGNSKGFERQVKEVVAQSEPKPDWVVFDAEATGDVDFTATTMLAELVGTLRERGITFAVAELNGRMQESLQRAGLEELIGAGKVFPSVDAATKAYLAEHPAVVVQRGTSARLSQRQSQAACPPLGRQFEGTVHVQKLSQDAGDLQGVQACADHLPGAAVSFGGHQPGDHGPQCAPDQRGRAGQRYQCGDQHRRVDDWPDPGADGVQHRQRHLCGHVCRRHGQLLACQHLSQDPDLLVWQPGSLPHRRSARAPHRRRQQCQERRSLWRHEPAPGALHDPGGAGHHLLPGAQPVDVDGHHHGCRGRDSVQPAAQHPEALQAAPGCA